MKKILLLALSLFLPLMVNASSVSVSGTTTMSPGESKTLSIIVNSTKAIHGGELKLTLNSDDFEILFAKSTSSYGTIKANASSSKIIVWNTEKALSNKGTLAKIVVKAKSNATVGAKASLTLSDVILSYKDGDSFVDEDVSNYTKTLTVGEPKSENNYLAKLSVEGYNIDFSKTKTSYNLNLPAGTTKLSITAKAEDETAKVAISGHTNLKEGKNTIKITVTAENGSKRVYTITAVVAEKDSLACNLKSLSIKGYTINFDPNTTEYRINVPYETTKVEISSVLANTDSTKKTEGPSTLSVGENIYTITVTDKDGNKKVYKVIVNREEEKQECEVCETCEVCEEKTDNIWKVLAIILVIVTLAETIYMVTMRDKKQI